MLIRNAEIWKSGLADLRIAGDTIAAIGSLAPQAGEQIIDAKGGLLIPGLHDHHIHLASSAVREQSVVCGPPEVTSAEDLAARLAQPGTGWLRGILYHESVMGLPDATALDSLAPERPIRIQHRSGRMWLLNSLAVDVLLANAAPPAGLERINGHYTGRLFDEDAWLQQALSSLPPCLADLSAQLAAYGITGVTDMSPANDPAQAAYFANQITNGHLVQRLHLAGALTLSNASRSPHWQIGPVKLHLHENALPDLDQTIALIRAAHDLGRPVASHCTTETELVFTIASFAAAGVLHGDRIEHAGIARDEHISTLAQLGLAVCGQPNFIAERGDRYAIDVEPELHHALYRLRAFRNAGVALAAGSDAPFGAPNPWKAMAAAVSRKSKGGILIGPDEALSPEQALELFLAHPKDLARQRTIAIGDTADLCLLSQPWHILRADLNSAQVRATVAAGKIIHHGIDNAPVTSFSG